MMRKIRKSIIYSCLLLSSFSIQAQSFYFGPKIGFSADYQAWNGFERQVLFAPSIAFFIESYDEEGKSSLLAQIGLYKRGSSDRQRFVSGFDQKRTFEFKNVSFSLGAKQTLYKTEKFDPYYIIAVRTEYTYATNLEQYQIYNGWYPIDPFVNKFNYGFTAGIGTVFNFSELIGGFLEFSMMPDVSKQYFQPPLENVIDPFFAGQKRNLPQQEIRNLSFEITLGMRFLRKIIYED